MGNFCTKCGKPLADGEVCNCQGAAPQIDPAQQAAPQQQSAAPQQQYQQAPQQQYQQVPPQQYQQQYQQMAPQQSAASDYFKQFFNTALNVWKKPVTAGKEYVMSGKFTLAIGYLLVQAVLAVILGMVFEARSSLANLAEIVGSSVGVTYVKVFFGTLFLSAIFSIMLAGLLLGFNLIAKDNMTFKNALCLVSVRSIVIAPAMVVALIIILINPAWGKPAYLSGRLHGKDQDIGRSFPCGRRACEGKRASGRTPGGKFGKRYGTSQGAGGTAPDE